MIRKIGFAFLALLLIALFLAVIGGCTPVSGPEPVNTTLTAMSASIAQRATESADEEKNAGVLITAQAKATKEAQSIMATQTARIGEQVEAVKSTDVASSPVIAELSKFGIDPSTGRVGWIHDPLTIELEGYQQIETGNDYMNVTAADFVLSADINWETQYGSSGCGFLFRSDGNKEKINQYMVIASRFANGRVIFMALSEGELGNMHGFYPKDTDPTFDWQNNTVNELTIVARGNLIELYTNGIKIGEVDTTEPPKPIPSPPKPAAPLDQSNQAAVDSYQEQLKEYEDIIKQSQLNYQKSLKKHQENPAVFEQGFLAMLAASESGRTRCTFSDAWLWLIEQ
jgi:Flp pilus assembly protein TadG